MAHCSPVQQGAGAFAGAYGVRLRGLEDATRLARALDCWGEWTVRASERPPSGRRSFVDDTSALVRFGDGSEIGIVRRGETGEAEIRLARPVPPADIVHPYLAPIGIVAAHWSSRLPLHAGAFLVEGRAWIMPADKGSGKTTTLAGIALAGGSVMADDLAVVGEGLTVFAGPRIVDLREDAALELKVGEHVGLLGVRERWRMALSPVPAEAPLGGIVLPMWGPTGLETLSLADRIQAVLPHIAVRKRGPWATLLMEAVTSVPVLRWTRTPGLQSLDQQVADLTVRLAEAS